MRKYVNRRRNYKSRARVSRKRSHFGGARSKGSRFTKKRFTKRRAGPKMTQHQRNLSYKVGTAHRPSLSFIKKVKDAISNSNAYTQQDSGFFTNGYNQSAYAIPSYPPCWYSHLNTIGASISTSKTLKYEVTGYNLNTSISNSCNADMNLRVYECCARKDVPLGSAYVSLSQIMQQGFLDAGNIGASTAIGGTLFESSAFCSWVKVCKVTNHVLKPGVTTNFRLSYNRPFMVNMDHINVTGSGIVMHPKPTNFFVFQFWGEPAVDDTATSNVVTGVRKMLWVQTIKYLYKWSMDLANSNVLSSNIPPITGGAAAETVSEVLGYGINEAIV